MAFAENLKALPGISHLQAIELVDAAGAVVATIENKPGQTGSLAVYNHLGQLYGAITAEAARKGLELYAEHAVDARAHLGKHPNIDRLLELAQGDGVFRLKHVFATGME
ncbi:MAG: DUF2322 family protein [Rhodocyclaceae bacterium]|nr:DUF2322 family protein [Rhodocyclaceae bacterium]MBK7813787.1 DUF2322 family protein [Rhodocyclaceae bacterium]MBK9956644.1 DUF2322 family protein [Rhodocyclaceae bacterium]